ncbi:MAG: hypothetical protein KC620_07355 [Myxococcales bacterium]|nr:hypothetical protein [Myxococcales bacterium]
MSLRPLALLISLLVPGLLHAEEVHRAPAIGIEVLVPDGWKLSTDGPMFTVLHEDPAVTLMFIPVDTGDAAQALEMLEPQLKPYLGKAEMEPPTAITINGLTGITGDGKTKLDEISALVSLMSLVIDARRSVVVVGLAQEEGVDKVTYEVGRVLKSIRRLELAKAPPAPTPKPAVDPAPPAASPY